MPTDLMEMVKGAVSRDVMGKLGGMLGQSPEKTSSAFDLAAGSILGGLMKKAASGGAEDIFRAAQNADTGVLDRLGDLMGGGAKADAVEKSGNGLLDMILGAGKSGLLGTLAKALGLDAQKIGKLLAMIAPIVMGILSKHIKNKALNAAGLGNLLGEQKSLLGNYLPSNLTSQLGFGNLVSSVQGAANKAAGQAGKMVDHASRAASHTGREAVQQGSSLLKFLLPLALVAAVGIGIWWWMNRGANPPSIPAGNSGGTQTSAPDLLGGFDLSGLQTSFDEITDGFENLTADSATGLAGKITGLTAKMDSLGLDKLGDGPKKLVSDAVGGFSGKLTELMGKVTDEGILGILRPVIDALIAKVKSFGFGG